MIERLTTRDRRLRLALTAEGLLTLVAIAIGMATSARPIGVNVYTLSPFVATSAFLVAGWAGWTRRPSSRIGLLLLITGDVYAASGLWTVDWAPLFTVSWLIGSSYQNVAAHMLLAFPGGRLRSRRERQLVLAFYATGAVGIIAASTLTDPKADCSCLPRNVLKVATLPHVSDTLVTATSALSVALAALFIVVLVRHRRTSAPSARKALAIVYAAGGLAALVEIAREVGDTVGASFQETPAWAWLTLAVTTALPLVFLVALLRLRMSRGTMGDLVVELGGDEATEGSLRDALARRLGDPTLELAYRLVDGAEWVDQEGRQTDRPRDAPGRAVTLLEHGGEPFAALTLDERLWEVPELVEGVVAAARLAIVNDRLRAEVRAQLEEVRASRKRIVEAADAARARVERDLHDGAQQRLVGMSLGLRMLREGLDADERGAEVDALQRELRDALAELRELARGLHPTILTEEGLGAAVESLAERSPVPVQVQVRTDRRFPAPVEATAYFVVAEALTNIAKYAHASRASVCVSRHDGMLSVEVTDDGVGGARIGAGSGLRGLEDRVAAMGGSIHIESPTRGGTRLHAEIPSA